MFPWYAFLTYAVVTAATPGPNNIMSMSNGNRLGFRGALPFNFGIWAGFTIVMVACTLFCTALSTLIPTIRLPMMILGAAYMLYLAWGTFRSSDVIQEDHSREGFLSGLLLQFINPKIYLYCIMSMGGIYPPLLRRTAGDSVSLCPAAGLHRVCIHPGLGGLRVGVPPPVLPARPGGEHHYGPAAGVLRRLPVSVSYTPRSSTCST